MENIYIYVYKSWSLKNKSVYNGEREREVVADIREVSSIGRKLRGTTFQSRWDTGAFASSSTSPT